MFETFLKYPTIYTHICYSVSVFNILDIPEFITWFKNYNLNNDRLYFNLIFNPDYLNIQSLPNSTKLKIKEKLNYKKN